MRCSVGRRRRLARRSLMRCVARSYLLVSVDGVRHNVKQLPGLGLERLLSVRGGIGGGGEGVGEGEVEGEPREGGGGGAQGRAEGRGQSGQATGEVDGAEHLGWD